MFLDTALCMAVKGTVVPFRSATEVPPAAAGAGAGAAGAALGGGGAAPLEATGAGADGAGAAAKPWHISGRQCTTIA